MCTYFPAEPGVWSSLGPVLAVLNWGGPAKKISPVLAERLQQLGQIPGWLKAGTGHVLAASKFSDHGALTALQAVVNAMGPTHELKLPGAQESRTHASYVVFAVKPGIVVVKPEKR
jgi:hypothetical protein